MTHRSLDGDKNGLVEGVLKQQFTDADGLLTWEKRRLVLDVPNLCLYISEIGSDAQPAISLRGVKYAKEWSFSSAVCGFGFDLVWFSGTMWNFMSDEESVCKYWVDSFNYAISLSIRNSHEANRSSNEVHLKPPLPPAAMRTSKELDNSFRASGGEFGLADQTMVEPTSPVHQYTHYHTAPDTADKFTPHREREQYAQAYARNSSADTHHQHYGQQHQQADTARRYQNATQDHSDDEHYAGHAYGAMAPVQQHVRESGSSMQAQRSLSQSIDHHDHYSAYGHAHSSQHLSTHTSQAQGQDNGATQHPQVPRATSSDAHGSSQAVPSRSRADSADLQSHHSAAHSTSHAAATQHTHAPAATNTTHGIAEADEGSSFFNSDRDPHSPLESVPGDIRETPEQHPGALPRSAAQSSVASNLPQRVLFGKLPLPGMVLPSAQQAAHSDGAWGQHHQQHQHQQSSAAGSYSSSQGVPTSVRMAERVDTERMLTAQAMSLDRPTTQAFAQEVATWQSKCQIQEMQLERKQHELETTKQRLSQLQERFDQSTAEFEQRLDLARDKERQLIAESKREMENKLMRMSNDNMSFFEAANKTLKLQHERELGCLREELAEERKRHTSLLDRSQTLRERAEKAEAEAQLELASLRDKYSTLHVEEARLRRELEIERAAFEKEKQRLVKQSEATITALQEEKEKSLVHAHQELRDKIAELNEKMQGSIRKIREADSEALRHEMEGQRLRSLSELQKKCQVDIEAVRTEERRLASIEVENIRNAFLSREHQTSEDLIQLERLHSTRVSQLEKQVLALKSENAAQAEKLRTAVQEAQHGSVQLQRGASEMKGRMEDYAARAEDLHRELLEAHQEIQEGKAREAGYREQLSQAITQARLQHAELLEAKQQVSSGTAQVFQWRNVTRESDLSISAAETALRIAKDEVTMLEHQLRRVEEENAQLKWELQRSDRLIYGAHVGNGRSDAANLNSSTLSTMHLLRGNLGTPSHAPNVSSALLTPTVSSNARMVTPSSSAIPKSGKVRKTSSTLKR